MCPRKDVALTTVSRRPYFRRMRLCREGLEDMILDILSEEMSPCLKSLVLINNSSKDLRNHEVYLEHL